jgi:hypothetical protein
MQYATLPAAPGDVPFQRFDLFGLRMNIAFAARSMPGELVERRKKSLTTDKRSEFPPPRLRVWRRGDGSRGRVGGLKSKGARVPSGPFD